MGKSFVIPVCFLSVNFGEMHEKDANCKLEIAAYLCIMAIRSKPNFVLLLADDLGIGDLGCYGNDTIRTPNIDKLAKEGVKLTQHIAAASLCTPSRAAFMTGRYAFRSGMDTCGGGRVIKWLGASGGLPPNETTFAKLLQNEGYSTGILGKWHLGVNCESLNDYCHHPLSHGFNYFYGIPLTLLNDCQPGGLHEIDVQFRAQLFFLTQLISYAVITMVIVKYSNILAISGKVVFWFALFGILFFMSWYLKYGFMEYWNCILMKNHTILEQPMNMQTLTNNVIRETLQFIERHKNVPFLLVVSFLHVHTPLVTTKPFVGKSKHGMYGDNVEEMDYMVGLIVNAIDNAGLKSNTLIYFTSDHGGHLEANNGSVQTGGWNGVYRGGKGMAGWEGGIRVPGIFRWPGIIPSDTIIEEPTSLMDIFSTVVNLGGGKSPEDRIIDGRDLFPLLTMKTSHSEHEFMFHFCGSSLHAARWHQKQSGATWKVHYVTPVFHPEGAVGCFDEILCGCEGEKVRRHDPPLLFELSTDPSESNPLQLHTDPFIKEVLDRIKAAIAEQQKTINVVPQQFSFYNNLWRPWLQPCCGTFPFCWCHQEDNHDTEGPPERAMDLYNAFEVIHFGTVPRFQSSDKSEYSLSALGLGRISQSPRENDILLSEVLLSEVMMPLKTELWIFLAIYHSSAYLCIMAAHSKPNFVLILADDLGIGDLGCYGNDTIRTPNIDRMAKEGVKLTQHLTAAQACTPSRAAFMTGRHAFRSGMDTYGGAPVLVWLGISGGLPTNETTFAKILQKEGYSTGIIGKWHLGVNCEYLNDNCHHPLNHGFNYFYGIPYTLTNECQPGGAPDYFTPFKAQMMFVTQLIGCAIITMVIVKYTNLCAISGKLIFYCALFGTLFFMTWYIKYGFFHYWNCVVMRNYEVVEQPINIPRMTNYMIKETQQFIERYKDGPFLLVVSFPHVHTPLVTTKSFIGRSKHGIYGDNVEEMDFMVGIVLKAIDDAGLKNNTLIYFASDHGGHIESKNGEIQTGGWNGIYRGGKGMAGWEGGIRVPGIFHWPGVIPSNTEVDEPTSLMDIFPTVVHLGGGKMLTDRIIDGRDLFPLLTKKTSQSEHEFLFHYCGNDLHAVRWHQKQSGVVWKVHYMTPVFFPEGAVGCYDKFMCSCIEQHNQRHDPPLIFELSADPSESNPLQIHTNPFYKEVLDRIKTAAMEHQKTMSVVPQQLSFYNNFWRPWLQPCCGTFPFCWCQQEDLNISNLM
ncbi:uncharacterized protein PAF06_004766 [Gastrophryne carolinensis]